MPENETFTTRYKCPLSGARLERDPGYTGLKRGVSPSETTYLRCPKCQPSLGENFPTWREQSWR